VEVGGQQMARAPLHAAQTAAVARKQRKKRTAAGATQCGSDGWHQVHLRPAIALTSCMQLSQQRGHCKLSPTSHCAAGDSAVLSRGCCVVNSIPVVDGSTVLSHTAGSTHLPQLTEPGCMSTGCL
jgi:hypothetical protein